jgi:predicted lipid-binding transport protein (Tim44 family)
VKTLISVVIALISMSLVVEDADARRLSGGRNMGMQRAPAQQQAAPKAPAQQQQQQQAAPATPAQQPAGASKWLGPLAGLALGAGLAALFLNNGLAGLLAGLLLIGLIVAAAALAARALSRGRVAREPIQYAGAGAGGGSHPTLGALSGGAGAHSVEATLERWPVGFDAGEFVRHARRNFVLLQEAYDRKDLSMMRDYLAPEIYRQIEADIRAAGTADERTEVLTLEAEVLEVVEETGSWIASVRFTGMLRDSSARDAKPFSETWHLEKPVDGRSGWVVAGIQQS